MDLLRLGSVPIRDERRLPEESCLPAGRPDIDRLGTGELPDDQWCALVAAELSPDLLVVIDPLLRAVWTNAAVERLLGLQRGEMLGDPVSDHVHPDDLMVAVGALNESQRNDGYHVATRIRVRRRDGSYIDTRVTATTITDESGTWMVLALRPVEDEVAIERRRAQLKALAQSVYVECAAVHWYELGDKIPAILGALAGVVGAHRVEVVEPRDGSFERVAGWSARGSTSCGSGRVQLLADPERLRAAPCVVTTVEPGGTGDRPDCGCGVDVEPTHRMVVELWLDVDGVVRLLFDEYTETWDDANADIIALMCSTMLATMRRCEQESELNIRATRDPLTRLLNRTALHQRLGEMLAGMDPARPPIVLFADLNRFKQLNDRFGHREGDAVLCRVADAISSQVRSDDVAARMGGDEFVIVVAGDDVPVATMVSRVRASIDAALVDWPDVGVAVGAIVAEVGESPEDLLDRADRAMYDDKARSRSARSVART